MKNRMPTKNKLFFKIMSENFVFNDVKVIRKPFDLSPSNRKYLQYHMICRINPKLWQNRRYEHLTLKYRDKLVYYTHKAEKV